MSPVLTVIVVLVVLAVLMLTIFFLLKRTNLGFKLYSLELLKERAREVEEEIKKSEDLNDKFIEILKRGNREMAKNRRVRSNVLERT